MDHQHGKNEHHHHILPTKTAVVVGVALIILTGVTVGVSYIDLGRLNLIVALVVATIKASLVAMVFMNLWYDKRENGVIFGTSFLFLAIFVVLTSADLFFRGDVYVKGPLVPIAAGNGPRVKNPWIGTPELVARGKKVFAANCTSCHGDQGFGDGPAAASLNPHPRNFHQDQGWKNGRQPSQIFKTVRDGLPNSPMASFATLPSDDRWAVAHFVNSLGPAPQPKDTPADIAMITKDPAKWGGGGGAEVKKTIPIDVAMSRLAVAGPEGMGQAQAGMPGMESNHPGAQLYRNQCMKCHGADAGGAKVRALGVNPPAYLLTRPLNHSNESMQSAEKFAAATVRGYPGDVMPGFGQLSQGELRDLFEYVRTLPGAQ